MPQIGMSCPTLPGVPEAPMTAILVGERKDMEGKENLLIIPYFGAFVEAKNASDRNVMSHFAGRAGGANDGDTCGGEEGHGGKRESPYYTVFWGLCRG